MEIKFKSLEIENFCSIKNLGFQFDDKKTTISGKNATGKSTVRNAIFWCLYGKLADGSNANKIRPHDENGKDIDFVDIKVVLTMVADGKEIVIKKVQKQNWTTPRGTTEKIFKGNVNEFEINDIPKKEKDYKQYIEDLIPMDTLLYCTNPMSFLSLDTKKRRNKLFELCSKLTNADVIKKNKAFKILEQPLKDGSIDELIAKAKKVIKVKSDELKQIPTRIDELEKQKIEIAVDELNKTIAEKETEIAERNNKLAELEKEREKAVKLQDLAMQMKFEINDLVAKANEDIVKSNRDKETLVLVQQKAVDEATINVKKAESQLDALNGLIVANKTAIKHLEKEITVAELEEYTASDVCTTCGQSLPKDKVENAKKEFLSQKLAKVDKLQKEIDRINHLIIEDQKEVENVKGIIKQFKSTLTNTTKKLQKAQDEANRPLVKADMSKDKKYLALIKKLEETESQIDMKSIENERQMLLTEIKELTEQVNICNKTLAKSEINEHIDYRIDELMESQVKIAQTIVDQEQYLDLLMEFNRTKIQMLTDSVNSYFDVVKWVMFEQQINGAFAEVCIPTVKGTSYDGLLNHGAKILVEMDICRAFQKANNVVVPITADDTESLDVDKIPNLPCQLILLRRTDDEKLTIGGGK